MNKSFLKKLGPGFLLAGAAIGVSHLVQATRAGADYGLIMLLAIILACVSKYPFLAIGAKYPAFEKKDLIEGYYNLGKPYLIVFGLFTIGSMFIILAAVTIVTAGLAEFVFAFELSIFTWSGIILGLCFILLQGGSYSKLDVLLKIVVSILTIATLTAVLIAIFKYQAPQINLASKGLWTVSGISFLVALMGWMPIPIDASVWQSIWVKEKQLTHKTNPSETQLDFNLGYFSASFLGVLFFLLGVLIMYGKDVQFSSNAVDFSKQLIQLYSETLGNWSTYFIGSIALITMFSTTITVADAYPRVLKQISAVRYKHKTGLKPLKNYTINSLLLCLVALALLYFLKSSFKALVDFAAGLSFLSSPVLAYFNYRLIKTSQIEELQPNRMQALFYGLCLFILLSIAIAYASLLIFG